ncbi:MAG TPA: hypothetical protein VK492_06940 [Chitinophagaceae bacterium]|nr:hypothetical protein [Chitinophagaceae bacterium]
MNKYTVPTLIVLMVVFFACGPSQKISTSWVNPDRPAKKYTTVFVAALIQNNAVKYALEADLGAAAKARGFNVVKGYEIFPPNFNKENMRDRELALKLIRDKGCDVILSIAVIDQKSETYYQPGAVSVSMGYGYHPYGGYGPYGSYGAYGTGFYGYYNYWQPTIYSPGYWQTDKTYFIEANAYDAETQQIIWSVQSKADNPSGIEKSSKEYTEMLFAQFDKERKKQK